MKWIAISMVCLILAGCVSAKYNVKTQEISYNRLGDQELGGVEIIISKDGTSVTFEKQKSEALLFRDMLAVIKEAYLLGLGAR